MSTIDDAIDEVEQFMPGHAWMFTKGRAELGEPLYGFAVFATRAGYMQDDDEEPLVLTEHDDPVACVHLALKELGG